MLEVKKGSLNKLLKIIYFTGKKQREIGKFELHYAYITNYVFMYTVLH